MGTFKPAAISERIRAVPQRKLSDEQVQRIKSSAWSSSALAREFGINTSAPVNTFGVCLTDGRERHSLVGFASREEAEKARDEFERNRGKPWPRGGISVTETGRFRVRLSLGEYATRWEAQRKIEEAMKLLAVNNVTITPVQ